MWMTNIAFGVAIALGAVGLYLLMLYPRSEGI